MKAFIEAIIQALLKFFCATYTEPPAPPPVQVTVNVTIPPAPMPEKPQITHDYLSIKEEYLAYLYHCRVNHGSELELDHIVNRILASKALYESVGLGVPWWFIALVHQMECGGSFKGHLHNGDPLTARTTHIPKGRPLMGEPPFSWVDSARDALTYENFVGLTTWSPAVAIYRLEKYNGFGYRCVGRPPTPYLWGCSNISAPGKFTEDGRYDPKAVTKQIGAGVILKELIARGCITE